jgi:hypothetical protein
MIAVVCMKDKTELPQLSNTEIAVTNGSDVSDHDYIVEKSVLCLSGKNIKH